MGQRENLDLEQVRDLAQLLLSGEGQVRGDQAQSLIDMLSGSSPARVVPTPPGVVADLERMIANQPDRSDVPVTSAPNAGAGATWSTVSEQDAMYPTVPPVDAPPPRVNVDIGEAIMEALPGLLASKEK